MRTPTRRKFGMVLIALSVLAGIIGVFIAGKTGDVQITRQGGSFGFYFINLPTQVTLDMNWLIPSFVLLVVGVVCLTWPSRKPPRIAS